MFKNNAFKKLIGIVMCLLTVFGLVSVDVPLFALRAEAQTEDGNPLTPDERMTLNFNNGWKFTLGECVGAHTKAFDDSGWRTVKLPHDYSIEQDFTIVNTEAESGRLPVGIAWYRKMITLPVELSGKEVYLNFDGVYNNAYIYVNGTLVGQNHYGYNSFTVNIGDYLTCYGSTWNTIAIKTEAEMPSSRWYSGAGIFRDVTITFMETLHVADNGVHVTTSDIIAASATANAAITIDNDSTASVNAVVNTYIVAPNGATVATAENTVEIISKSSQTVNAQYTVANPLIWDIDSPNLYTIRTEVYKNGQKTDEYSTTFGFRTIEWTVDNGFKLNGRFLKIKGMCMHHDQGALGAIQEYDAIYRQLKILKDMGCNAVRTSHNSTSRVFIEICERLGLLVMEEFFDGWSIKKNDNSKDFSQYFNSLVKPTDPGTGLKKNTKLVGAEDNMTWAKFVVKQTMLRDRNSPAIIIWSIGNEIPSPTNNSSITAADNLCNWVREYDTTRPITEGNDKQQLLRIDQNVDVIGANYHPEAWVQLKTTTSNINKPFIATEAVSAITSRGEYWYNNQNREGGKLSKTPKSLYSYDNSYVTWGNSASYGWYYTITNDWFSGEFVWTGFDYIGEPTPWNNKNPGGSVDDPNSSYFGVVDTAGFPKDQYYLYRSWWNDNDTTLHLLPGTWNRDNLYIKDGFAYVNVYSNAKKIKLFFKPQNSDTEIHIATATSTDVQSNGGLYTYKQWTESEMNSSIQCNDGEIYVLPGVTGPESMYAQFRVAYEEGTLSVKAYDEADNEITDTVGTKSVSSGKPAVRISSKLWGEDNFTANSDSYAYIEFEAVDENGNFVNDYNEEITVSVSNDGEIVGVDNGYQATVKKFQNSSVELTGNTAKIKLYNGRAVAIVKTKDVVHEITVTATFTDPQNTLPISGTTFSAQQQTQEYANSLFENMIYQSPTPYEPSIFDRFVLAKVIIDDLDPAGSTIEYNRYYATSEAVVIPDYLPTGDYFVVGKSGNSRSKGVMLPEVSGVTEPSIKCNGNMIPAESNPQWHFERLENGNYYVYSTVDGVDKYITLTASNECLTLSEEPYELTVTLDPATHKVTIGNGTQYVNYSGGNVNAVSSWSEPTALTLYRLGYGSIPEWYETDAGVEIEEGKYALVGYRNSNRTEYTVLNTMSNGRLNTSISEFDGSKLLFEADDYFYIEKYGNTKMYQIKNKLGQYINIGTTDDSISYSETPQAIKATLCPDGRVAFSSGSQYLDFFSNEKQVSTWTCANANNRNNQFTLYRRNLVGSGTVDPSYSDLYAQLLMLEQHAPDTYDSAKYEIYLNAVENGIAVYKDNSSTDEQRNEATQAIVVAMNNLISAIIKFEARLIKYGYSPERTGTYTRYYGGGYDFNMMTFAEMENAIRHNDELMSQIKTIIDYDGLNGTNWGEGYADIALNTAVSEYAKLYSLSFVDSSVTNGFLVDDSLGHCYRTNWNHWAKDNTRGVGERQNEGVSNQGIFSERLGLEKVPVEHTVYDLNGGLSYHSGSSGTERSVKDPVVVSVQKNASQSVNLTLSYLNNISVHVPDFFSAEDVLSTNTDNKATYSKYYWDTQFPFFMTTDQDGLNHYVYDSSDPSHMVRASYSDADHTAVVDMFTEEDWGVNRPYAGVGKGFFPFNYRTDTNSSLDHTTEKGIYHFGMTFEMGFYIPKGGKMTKTSEDYVFSFSGDDDVLVYVDDVLVLDNGGLHGKRACSINFTEASVSYQYAMNIADRELISTYKDSNGNYIIGENRVEYKYGEEYDNISVENQAAIDYLHEILNDGEEHIFRFFYLERGSTESNCKITFNLQETSKHVKLEDQVLVADYGLPISYNITENNSFTPEAIALDANVKYIGITDTVEKAVSFTSPQLKNHELLEEGQTIHRQGTYGDFTISQNGDITYTPKTMEFTGNDSFFMCAEVSHDPTYSSGIVYYTYEKVTVVPATNIYYEENFREGSSGSISYTDGSTAAGFDNSTAGHGTWSDAVNGNVEDYQAADLVGDPFANCYGFDPAYSNSAGYSNGTAKKVTVSTKNNPNSYYSGGTGGSWPEFRFTFKGTGFDLLSVTDHTTGLFTVKVYEGTNTATTPVRSHVVDTYYGYSYARLYADASGNETSTVTDVPLYWTKENKITTAKTYYGTDGVITRDVHYYDVSGIGYTDTPTYYDEYDNLTSVESDRPAYSYAYAYGWIKDENSSTVSLYQIPVISEENLPYGEYTAVILAKFTDMFKHYNTDEINGESVKSYDLYVDGVRIYNPAGIDNSIEDKVVKESYLYDHESYPCYIELRNMLIGTDSFGENNTENGIIFIDGIPALENDIKKYRLAGPNNELYLHSGQAVAFDVWATAAPTDVQLFAKSVYGSPTIKVTYHGRSSEKTVDSATQMAYSLNSFVPITNKLEFTTQIDPDSKKTYYASGTIVIANSSTQDSILSLGRLKWLFELYGAKGYYKIAKPPQDEELELMSTMSTYSAACSVVSTLNTETAILRKNISVPKRTLAVGEPTTVTVTTSEDVKSLIVQDNYGKDIMPLSMCSEPSQTEGKTVWSLTLSPEAEGENTYALTGVNSYGALGSSSAQFSLYAVNDTPGENPEDNPGTNPEDNSNNTPEDNPGGNTDDNPGENTDDKPGGNTEDKPGGSSSGTSQKYSWLDKIVAFFRIIFDFLMSLFG